MFAKYKLTRIPLLARQSLSNENSFLAPEIVRIDEDLIFDNGTKIEA